jgi:hypothetical protein
MEKKRKAEEKRARCRRKKWEASGASEPDIANPSVAEETEASQSLTEGR